MIHFSKLLVQIGICHQANHQALDNVMCVPAYHMELKVVLYTYMANPQ